MDEPLAFDDGELDALERALYGVEDTIARPDPGPSVGAPDVATPVPPPARIPGPASRCVDEEATLPPSDQVTVDSDSSAPAPPAAPEPARVRSFGDYEITRELARGGMGIVFHARQVSLNRPVALKMILAGQLADKADVKRFHTEAEAAANLDHPGIVPVYEVGRHEGRHYLSMGFVDGPSLAQRLAGGPLPPREAAALMLKVADAIEYAHRRGVIHRDLKPGNILLDRSGHPRVTDFGLAKKVEGDSSLTVTGQIIGTPSYMPPEQAAGHSGRVGPAADVYAIGATLYSAVTGRPPFQAATPMDTILMVMSKEPVPPRRLNAAIPRDLETICLKCLEKEPARRYTSAQAVADDLRRFLDGEPIVARPATRFERAAKWARRRPALAALGAATTMATVLGIAGVVWQWRNAEHNFALAEGQRGIAVSQQRRAEDLAGDLQQNLYSARINLAHQAWQSGDIGRVLDLLDGLRPAAGQPDLRGFEWYYLRWLCHRERLVLQGPTGPVKSVAFAPDGKLIAMANQASVVLCDAATGQTRATLWGRGARVLCVAFSPDGALVASGSEDGKVRIWDVALAGTAEFVLEGHSGPIGSLAFAPDGQALATASGVVLGGVGTPIDRFVRDGAAEVRLWRVGRGKDRGWTATRLVAAKAFGLAFAPDGKTLATADAAGTVTLWDAATGQRLRVLSGHQWPAFAIAFAPDGKTLASGSYDQTTRIWDVATSQQKAVLTRDSGAVFAVAFAPDGRTLASGGYDQTVSLWDVATGQERGRIRGHTNRVWSVAFAPDGETLATASEDGTVRLWDPHEPQDRDSLEGQWADRGHGAFSLAFSPGGKILATTNDDVKLWEAAAREPIAVLENLRSGDIHVAFAPDGRTIAAGGVGGQVVLWDATTRRVRIELPRHRTWIWSLAFTPDSRTLATGSQDGIVRLWDAATGRPLRQLDAGTGTYVRALAYSRDGRTLAAAYHLGAQDQSALLLWDVASGRVRETLRGHTRLIEWIALAPDGRTLASGGWDRTVRLWDMSSGRSKSVLKGHLDVIYDGSFSPDGRTLATASWDGTVRLWHVATGQELVTLRSRTGECWSVAFAPDGQTLAAGSTSRHAGSEVLLWHAAAVPDSLGRTRREAGRRVQSLFDKLLVREDVLERLRNDDVLSAPVRKEALILAERHPEDPGRLNDTSWAVVRRPGLGTEDYRRALRYAEAACRLAPRDSASLNTLGVARYRAGEYREALDVLNRSLPLNAAQFGDTLPADLAFIALAQYRLDRTEEARAALGRLRAAMAKPRWANDAESQGFLREANTIDDPIAEGATLASRGRWEEGAAAFARAFAGQTPALPYLWFEHAILRLAVGDAASYRSTCRHMLERFRATNEVQWLEYVAHAWALAPDGPTERAQALELAQRRAAVMPNPWTDHVLGLALYRAGRFADADARLRMSLDHDPGWDCHVLDWLVLAMAQQRLGRPEEARQWLERAERWAERRLRGRPGGVARALVENWIWHDAMLLHLLLREARALVKKDLLDLPDDVFAPPLRDGSLR